jgi:hypothetical protein
MSDLLDHRRGYWAVAPQEESVHAKIILASEIRAAEIWPAEDCCLQMAADWQLPPRKMAAD